MGKGSGGCDRPAMMGVAGSAGCNRDRILAVVRSMPFEHIYEVGGVIRDELLGRPIADVDIAVVGEDYESLERGLHRYGRADELEVGGRLVGLRVWSDWTGPKGVEFALARTEVSTGAGYHDFDIVPDPSIDIEADLERRDFTVNAIARDARTGEVFDPFGGVADARDRVLRTVSPTSFRDDALRMLRGLVRISKDDLDPTDDVIQQMREHAASLRHDAPHKPVSGERVREEMEKLLSGDHPHKALQIGRDTGALEAAIPEFAVVDGFDQQSKYHDLSLDEHVFLAAQRASDWNASMAVRWAALLHDFGKPESAWMGEDGRLHYYRKGAQPGHETVGAEIAERVWDRLGGDKATRQRISALIANHMYREDSDCAARLAAGKHVKLERSARRWLARVGDAADDLMMLRRCDRGAKHETLPDGWDADLTAWESVVASQRHQPLTRRDLSINGNDLNALGAEGRQVGELLSELLRRVIDNPQYNEPARLRDWARSLMG